MQRNQELSFSQDDSEVYVKEEQKDENVLNMSNFMSEVV
jgi:hypothetical protein